MRPANKAIAAALNKESDSRDDLRIIYGVTDWL